MRYQSKDLGSNPSVIMSFFSFHRKISNSLKLDINIKGLQDFAPPKYYALLSIFIKIIKRFYLN